MRLFIAIQFEEKILDALNDFQDDLKEKGVTGNYAGIVVFLYLVLLRIFDHKEILDKALNQKIK